MGNPDMLKCVIIFSDFSGCETLNNYTLGVCVQDFGNIYWIPALLVVCVVCDKIEIYFSFYGWDGWKPWSDWGRMRMFGDSHGHMRWLFYCLRWRECCLTWDYMTWWWCLVMVFHGCTWCALLQSGQAGGVWVCKQARSGERQPFCYVPVVLRPRWLMMNYHGNSVNCGWEKCDEHLDEVLCQYWRVSGPHLKDSSRECLTW